MAASPESIAAAESQVADIGKQISAINDQIDALQKQDSDIQVARSRAKDQNADSATIDGFNKQQAEVRAKIAALEKQQDPLFAQQTTLQKQINDDKYELATTAQSASSNTAADKASPASDNTGKDSSTNSTAQPITSKEQENISAASNPVDTTNVVAAAPSAKVEPPPEKIDPAIANKPAVNGVLPAVVVVGTRDTKPTITITPNKLHQYSTYTYSLTLHLLTKESFNDMADNPSKLSWLKDAKTIISSGGKYSTVTGSKIGYHRPIQFKEDILLSILFLMGIILHTMG